MKHKILFLLLPLAATLSVAAASTIIPQPVQLQTNTGVFTLCSAAPVPGAPTEAAVRIFADTASRESGNYLSALFLKSTGQRFAVLSATNGSAVSGGILLTTSGALTNLGAEGYELTVATNSVVVRAPNSAGVFYGVQSLLQLLPPQVLSPTPMTNVAWTAPCLYVQDQPRFSWRGWMLDVSRHFFTKDEVKRSLDAMALHKLNVFHWHLSDDEGFRVEILKYPSLTQTGAWRSSGMGWSLNPKSSTAWNAVGQYGGFYTQADIREVVAYAAQRHITIVPEIDMPGHSRAILSAYPQYGPSGSNIDSPATAIPFLEDILTELMALFPGKYIHTGGDEVNGNPWLSNAPDVAKMQQLGITTASAYQHWFSAQIANFLQAHGRTMIGWSEIEYGGILGNSACMDWLDNEAVAVANAGQGVVRSPTYTCYLDYTEYPGNTWSLEPPSIGGNVPLSTVYNFEPMPGGLTGAATNNILGAQGNTWCEYIPSLRNVQFKTFPRLLALAETTWTPAALKNYSDFTNRLATGFLRLDQLGVNYNRGSQPQAGVWTTHNTPASFASLDFDITAKVTGPEVGVSFFYTSGTNALSIAWVALLQNGVELDRDTHAGTAGSSSNMARYVLRLPAVKPGATYTLRANVQGSGGTNSAGVVYLPNWD